MKTTVRNVLFSVLAGFAVLALTRSFHAPSTSARSSAQAPLLRDALASVPDSDPSSSNGGPSGDSEFARQLEKIKSAASDVKAELAERLEAAPKAARAQRRYVLIFLVDNFGADLFSDMLQKGELPNIQEQARRGVSVRYGISANPSATGPAHTPVLTGKNPGPAGIPSLRWYDPTKRQIRSYAGPDALAAFNRDLDKNTKTLFELLPNEISVAVYEPITRGARAMVPPLGQLAKLTSFISAENRVQDVLRKLPFLTKFSMTLGIDPSIDGETLKWMNVDTAGSVIAQMVYQGNKDINVQGFHSSKLLAGVPGVMFIWFPGVDTVAHMYGPGNPQIRYAVQNADKAIGRVVQAIQDIGIYDQTTILVTSDHGQGASNNHEDLDQFARKDLQLDLMDKMGLETLAAKMGLGEYDIVITPDGNKFALVYVSKDGKVEKSLPLQMSRHDWSRRPTTDELRHLPIWKKALNGSMTRIGEMNLIDRFARNEAVEQVVSQESANSFVVSTSNGESRIAAQGQSYQYSVLRGQDPFGYAGLPKARALMDGQYHPDEEWLQATYDAEFPDAIARIPQLFVSQRTGALALYAKPDWDLRKEYGKFNGSHGDLHKQSSLIPIVFAGPGIRHGEIETMRAVDMFPVLLKQMGMSEDAIGQLGLDGKLRKEVFVDPQ